MYINNNCLERLSSLGKVTNTLNRVSIGDYLTLFYSYKTIVGFIYKGNLTLVENIYSKTTTRDLNVIDRGNRVSLEVFKIRLRKLLYKLGLINSKNFIIEEYRDLEILKGYTKIGKEVEKRFSSNPNYNNSIIESIEGVLRYIVRVEIDNPEELKRIEETIEENLDKDNYILLELLDRRIKESLDN